MRIDLMDHDGAHPLIGDLQRSRFSILHADLLWIGIQRVTIRCLPLNDCVPAALCIGDMDNAVAVSGVGAQDLTVHLPDFELDALNALACIFILLNNLQSTCGRIVES